MSQPDPTRYLRCARGLYWDLQDSRMVIANGSTIVGSFDDAGIDLTNFTTVVGWRT